MLKKVHVRFELSSVAYLGRVSAFRQGRRVAFRWFDTRLGGSQAEAVRSLLEELPRTGFVQCLSDGVLMFLEV